MINTRTVKIRSEIKNSTHRSRLNSFQKIFQKIEEMAPLAFAEAWDNVGLMVGRASTACTGAVVTIDLTPSAVQFAKLKKANLIILHHPPIFPKSKGITHWTESLSGPAKVLFDAWEAGISVYCCHTNYDRGAIDGFEKVAQQLGLKGPFSRLGEDEEGLFKKLVVFVPIKDRERVQEALFKAGAGKIGQYDSCSFHSLGEGSFRGLEGSRPRVGQVMNFEKAQEVRLEVAVPNGFESKVLSALRQTHPYEEIAYDWIRLANRFSEVGGFKGFHSGIGYGVVGSFNKPVSFKILTNSIKKCFKLDGMLVTALGKEAALNQLKVRRVGFSAGKGSSFVASALRAKCDVYISGELGYHSAMDAARAGLVTVELGHRKSEIQFLSTVSGWVSQVLEPKKVFEFNEITQRIL